MAEFILHTVTIACIGLFPTLGYNLVFGKGKILHFGQGAQSIAAVYTLWVLVTQFHWSYASALTASVFVTLALSWLLGWLSLRLEPDGFGVMSIALHLMLLSVVLNWQSVTRGPLGIPGIPRSPLPQDPLWFAIIIICMLCLWVALLLWIHQSSLGRKLTALSEHSWHAQSLGIHQARVHLLAFTVSGLGSVLSGATFASYLYLLTPYNYNFPVMIFVIMCIVAGGPGNVRGVVLSTLGLYSLQEALRFIELAPEYVGPLRLILFGGILFAAVWYRRDTLFPKQRSI